MTQSNKILIIDDDPNLLRTLSDILQLKNFTPITARTGHAALEVIQQEEIAVALIDLRLSDMGGLDILAAIRRRSPETECILLTGYASQDSAIAAVNLGVFSYLQKPFNIDQLIIIIQRANEKQTNAKLLREREATLSSIFRAAPVGIGLVSNRVLLQVNDQICQMTGYSRSELVGQSTRLLYLSDKEFDLVGSEKYQVNQDYHITTIETQWKRKDGCIRDITISSTLIDSANLEAGVSFVATDITERKKVEKALSDSEEQYRTLFNTMAEGAIYQDRDGLITVANPAAEQILGLPADQLIGLHSIDPQSRSIHEDGTPFPVNTHPANTSLQTGQPVLNSVMGIYNPIKQEYRWIIINAIPQFLPVATQPYQAFSTFTDITERKRAEEHLSESQQRLAILMSNLPGMVYRCKNDDDWMMEFVSEGSFDLTGYYPDEFTKDAGISYSNIVHPDDVQRIYEQIRSSLSQGKPFQFTYRVCTKEGEEKWVWEQGRGVKSPSGDTIFLEGLIMDVSLQKQYEQKLEESLRNLEEAEKIAHLGQYRLDFQTGLVTASREIERIFGADQKLGLFTFETISELIHPDDIQNVFEMYESAAKDNIAFDLIYRIFRRDGEMRFVHNLAKPYFGPDGKSQQFFGTLQDITEQRQAEIALREAQEYFKVLFDQSPDAIFILDLEGRHVEVNNRACQMLGYPREELLKLSVRESSSQVQESVDTIRRLTNGEFIPAYERILRKKNGDLVPVEIHLNLILDAEGNPYRVQSIAHEITQRKKAEQEIQRYIGELEAIYQNGLSINRLFNLQEIGRKIIETFADHLSWHHVIIRLRKSDSDELEVIAFNQSGLLSEEEAHLESVYNSKIGDVGQGLSGWVIKSGQAIRTGNVHEFPQYVDSYPGIQSGLYMPLIIGDRVIGVISVESEVPNAFTDSDERLLSTLAAQAAVAFENTRLFAEVRQRAEVFTALYQATHDLANVTDSSVLMETITHRITEIFGVTGAALMEYHPQTAEAEVLTSTSQLVPVNTRLKLGKEMVNIMVQSQKPLISNESTQWEVLSGQSADLKVASSIMAPLFYGNDLLGILVAYEFVNETLSLPTHNFHEEDKIIFSLFAGVAANAIFSARLLDETRNKADRLSVLYDVSKSLNQISDPIAIGNMIVPALVNFMGWHHGGVWLVNEDNNLARVTVKTDLDPWVENRVLRPGEGIVGWVIKHGQTVRSGDVLKDPRYFKIDSTTRSELCVPLSTGGKVIGCINFESDAIAYFTQEDEHLLLMLAAEVSSAIERAHLYEQMRNRLGELEALVHFGKVLTTTQNIHTLLLNVLNTAKWAIPAAEKCSILLYENEKLRIRAMVGYESPELYQVDFLSEDRHASRAFKEERGIMVLDSEFEDPKPMAQTPDEINQVKSGIAVPLVVKDKTIGVICLDNVSRTSAFTQNDMNLLSAFASSAAQFIEGVRLFDETDRQAKELGAIVHVAAALRRVVTRSEMQVVILNEIQAIVNADCAAILSRDPTNKKNILELGIGECDLNAKIPVAPDEAVVNTVISTGQLFVSSDRSNFVPSGNPRLAGESMAVACLPLIAEADVIGALWIMKGLAFTESEINILTAVADMAANAIRRAGLYERTIQYSEQVMRINTAGRALSETLNLPDVYGRLTESLYQLFTDICSVFVFQYDSESEVIRCTSAQKDGNYFDVGNLPIHSIDKSGGCVHGRVILSKQPITQSSIDIEDGTPILSKISNFGKLASSAISVPMIMQKQVIGLILVQSYTPGRFSQTDVELLGLVANNAAAAIENARLYMMVQVRLAEREEAQKALMAAQAELEQRVDERTAALSRANSELARAMRGRDEFLANMSHELRTPLNAILGISESLEEQVVGPLNEKQIKYIRTVNESGRHLLTLINDILDLSKIEAGRMTLDFQHVRTEIIIQSALRLVKELAQKKQVSVTFTTDGSADSFYVDGRRIKQVLVNLLSNAVKFTASGGKIGLDVSGDANAGQMTMTVWDTGIGIKEADLSRLFQPFIQLDAGLNREHSGTGLGLAMVSQIIKLHGGRVDVESVLGEGSRFKVILPWLPERREDADSSSKSLAPETASSTKKKFKKGKILLVDDTESVGLFVKDYLEAVGHEVHLAHNGYDGINAAKSLRPDVILMDVQMPGLSGLEATQKIREIDYLKHTTIIALTAMAMSGDRERCLAVGMNDYLSKPVHLLDLVKLIDQFLQRARKGKPS